MANPSHLPVAKSNTSKFQSNSSFHCVPYIRGFTPLRRATFVSAKVAKTIHAPAGLIAEEGRQL